MSSEEPTHADTPQSTGQEAGGQHTDVPKVHMDVPPAHSDVPSVHTDVPKVHMDTETVGIHTDASVVPHGDVKTSHQDASVTPHGDTSIPHADAVASTGDAPPDEGASKEDED